MNNLSEKPITLTDNAAKHIQSELDKSKQDASSSNIVGLKIGVKTTGCSGYAYTLDWIKSDTNLDTENFHKFISHNIDIYVDNKSYELISGTEVDYVSQGISRVMVFRNPNATAECGCGESFTVDQDKAQ